MIAETLKQGHPAVVGSELQLRLKQINAPESSTKVKVVELTEITCACVDSGAPLPSPIL
jgi:hypothetical protein